MVPREECEWPKNIANRLAGRRRGQPTLTSVDLEPDGNRAGDKLSPLVYSLDLAPKFRAGEKPWFTVELTAFMPRILVVDDSPSMRAFVRTALEDPAASAGQELTIVEAASGFDALRLLPRGPYALVITDINMPDINGLELVRFIRGNEQHQGTPVILISTQSSERDRQRGLSLGADAYLAKPFTEEALRKLALEQLERPRLKAGPHG